MMVQHHGLYYALVAELGKLGYEAFAGELRRAGLVDEPHCGSKRRVELEDAVVDTPQGAVYIGTVEAR